MTVGDSSLESSYRMEGSGKTIRVSVLWKGNKYTLEIDSGVSMKDLGYELRKLTDVTAETLRLIVPRLNERGSKLIFPSSDEHSSLSLKESNIIEDKTIRMIGVTEEEVGGVLKDAMPEMRILGFEEEERRLRQKKSSGSIKLPQGNYIFCDFRTLHLPGVDHRWRVGIMTELAPVGYVGVSPQCLLGFNKNQGEEISLRLRTDDLKGFRKYQSIKKTLLHELAHMVYTEHDENFYALDRQLNKEAESLDWTKSRGHTLTGTKFINDFEEDDFFDENENVSQRLGGNQSDYLGDARESSVAAAYRRLSHTSEKSDVSVSKLNEEPDPDDLVDARDENKQSILCKAESDSLSKFEPDPDHTTEDSGAEIISDNSMIPSNLRDPSEPEHHSGSTEIASDLAHPSEDDNEPDPDDLETRPSIGEVNNKNTSIDKVMSVGNLNADETMQATPDPNNAEPYPDNNLAVTERETIMEADEPDPDDQEIQRIQNSVTIISNRLKKAINALKTEVSPSQATNVLRMLLKIVRNIIEQPHEMKFKRLRKGNPAIQRNILNFSGLTSSIS